MKPNTLIQLPDGTVGRTVYHNLDGIGIAYGREMHDVDNLPEPDAMLRDDYPAAIYECVGDEYVILEG